MNERFGFARLDTTTALVPALPVLPRAGRAHVAVEPVRSPDGSAVRDLEIFRDHQHARAARHVVLERGSRSCYVICRRDRRKGLPLFASLLHASDPAALPALLPALSTHLLVRHRVPVILAELCFTTLRPPKSIMLTRSSRPKIFRSPTLAAEAIDYLYSELTCVAW